MSFRTFRLLPVQPTRGRVAVEGFETCPEYILSCILSACPNGQQSKGEVEGFIEG